MTFIGLCRRSPQLQNGVFAEEKRLCEKSRIMRFVTAEMSEWTRHSTWKLTQSDERERTGENARVEMQKCTRHVTSRYEESISRFASFFSLFCASFIFITRICSSVHRTKSILSAHEMLQMARMREKEVDGNEIGKVTNGTSRCRMKKWNDSVSLINRCWATQLLANVEIKEQKKQVLRDRQSIKTISCVTRIHSASFPWLYCKGYFSSSTNTSCVSRILEWRAGKNMDFFLFISRASRNVLPKLSWTIWSV